MHFSYSWGPVLSEDVKTHRKNDFSQLKRVLRHWECYTQQSIPNTVVAYTVKTVQFPVQLMPTLRLSLLTCNSAVLLTSVLQAPANIAMSLGPYCYMQPTEIPVPAEICSIVIISVLMFQQFILQPRALYSVLHEDVVILFALKIVTSSNNTKINSWD